MPSHASFFNLSILTISSFSNFSNICIRLVDSLYDKFALFVAFWTSMLELNTVVTFNFLGASFAYFLTASGRVTCGTWRKIGTSAASVFVKKGFVLLYLISECIIFYAK